MPRTYSYAQQTEFRETVKSQGGFIRCGGPEGESVEFTHEGEKIALRGEDLIEFLFLLKSEYDEMQYKIRDLLDEKNVPTGEFLPNGDRVYFELDERIQRALSSLEPVG